MWPALTVLLLAVGTLVIFLSINMIFDQGVSTPTSTTMAATVVGAVPADTAPSPALAGCDAAANVPSNITDAFIWPAGTTSASTTIVNAGAGDFDCVTTFTSSTYSASQLLAFFNGELSVNGWNLFSQGASNGDPQYLFQKAGSDTFYWVVGVTVTRSRGSALTWTFRAYQNSSTI
jgi:hypothetical protein